MLDAYNLNSASDSGSATKSSVITKLSCYRFKYIIFGIDHSEVVCVRHTEGALKHFLNHRQPVSCTLRNTTTLINLQNSVNILICTSLVSQTLIKWSTRHNLLCDNAQWCGPCATLVASRSDRCLCLCSCSERETQPLHQREPHIALL
jgi:hypothetical protein